LVHGKLEIIHAILQVTWDNNQPICLLKQYELKQKQKLKYIETLQLHLVDFTCKKYACLKRGEEINKLSYFNFKNTFLK